MSRQESAELLRFRAHSARPIDGSRQGMKAVVVGAGIAGLVAARQLGLAGWDVETPREIGRLRAPMAT